MSDTKSDARFVIEMLIARKRDINNQIVTLSGDSQRIDRILAELEGADTSPDKSGEVIPLKRRGGYKRNMNGKTIRRDRAKVLWRTLVNTTGPKHSWKPVTVNQIGSDSGYTRSEWAAVGAMLNTMAKAGTLTYTTKGRTRSYSVPEAFRNVKHYDDVLELVSDTRKDDTSADG